MQSWRRPFSLSAQYLCVDHAKRRRAVTDMRVVVDTIQNEVVLHGPLVYLNITIALCVEPSSSDTVSSRHVPFQASTVLQFTEYWLLAAS